MQIGQRLQRRLVDRRVRLLRRLARAHERDRARARTEQGAKPIDHAGGGETIDWVQTLFSSRDHGYLQDGSALSKAHAAVRASAISRGRTRPEGKAASVAPWTK
ncbi:MAG: hypothetical protein IT385_11370 [Deltaproteobacteria bacterium]|nr:hypothetical protein [Deltaproteobacteria bacterium]